MHQKDAFGNMVLWSFMAIFGNETYTLLKMFQKRIN